MVEYDARVVLSYEVYKKIMWFTENYDKEIGAVGTVKIRQEEGDKYFYIDNIYFPKQEVSYATVHFTPEMWGDLIKELSIEDLSRIGFYWHKHPGSASHSHTDEESTFETFMGKEAKRKYFIFAQTAIKSNGELDAEWRVDIRHPIRASIRDSQVLWEYEAPPEDEALEEECKAIIEKCVVKPTPKKSTYPTKGISYYDNYGNDYYKRRTYNSYNYPKKEVKEAEALDILFGNYVERKKGHITFDNDSLNDIATSLDEKAGVEFKDGAVNCLAGNLWKTVLNSALKVNGKLNKYARSFKWLATKEGSLSKLKIQPKAGSYDKLCEAVKDLYAKFNKAIINEWKKSGVFNEEDKELGKSSLYIDDSDLLQTIIEELVSGYFVDFTDPAEAIVYSDYNGDLMGRMKYYQTADTATFFGKELIKLVEEIMPVAKQIKNFSGTLEKAVADTTKEDEKKEEEQ